MAWVTIDGQRVASGVAASFNALKTAFHAVFGLWLLISSGTRTRAEQESIFRSRYVTAGNVNGRKVYDTRVWNGVRWYRVSSAGTVAVPGTSNHEESGPIGPRALDVRDSGGDAGVTRAGTTRANWLRANAPRYGFNPAGYGFGEPWHIEWTGSDPHGGSGGGQASGFNQGVQNQQAYLNAAQGEKLATDGIAGPLFMAAVKRYQEYLKGRGWYSGVIDGIWGQGTQGGHEKRYREWEASKNQGGGSGGGSGASIDPKAILSWDWSGIAAMLRCTGRYSGNNVPGPQMVKGLQRFLGIVQDGIVGRNTVSSVQRWLNNTGRNAGSVDGLPGGQTKSAWDKANAENGAAFSRCRQ